MSPGSIDLINIDRNNKSSLRRAIWSIQRKLIPITTTATHFIPPFRNYSQLKEKMIKIKIKGYQLLEITKKLTSSGSWFK